MTDKQTADTIGELIDRLTALRDEYGDDTPVRLKSDDVILPNVATSYHDDGDDDLILFE